MASGGVAFSLNEEEEGDTANNGKRRITVIVKSRVSSELSADAVDKTPRFVFLERTDKATAPVAIVQISTEYISSNFSFGLS